MANIVVKNGYNGFNTNKGCKEHNQQKHLAFSKTLPPLHTRENGFIPADLKEAFCPMLQPSISDHTTPATGDIVILLDDEIRRIQQLSIHLGINHRYEIAEYHNRFHVRAKPDNLPKIESSKCWVQSHNWRRRTDNERRLDLSRTDAALGKKIHDIDSSIVNLDRLPKGRRKFLEPVDIPLLGCSYRLPVIMKNKRSTGR